MRAPLSLYLFLLLLALTACTSSDHRLYSPDGRIALAFSLPEGSPRFDITYNQKPILQSADLGFHFRGQPALTTGFELVNTATAKRDTTWDLPWGEWDQVRDHHNELQIRLREKATPNRELSIIFRAFNDGIAFRYILHPQPAIDSIFITQEATAFTFADNYTTWSIPPDHDTYEHLYRQRPLDSLEGGNTPLTMRAHGTVHISLHEAALVDYPEMALRKDSTRNLTLRANLAPWPDGDRVKTTLPCTTPWRTIQIAPTAGKLVESTMILNLNEPSRIKDISWIQPMKYIGIWWGMHINKNTWTQGPKHGATTAETMRHIKFAAENGIPGVLVEGWNTGWERWGQEGAWDYVTPYDDFDLPYLAAQARAHGVELIGHHETGGDVPTYDRMLDSAFALYASLGIRCVKTGYAGKIRPEGQLHHGQWMVRHYQKVVETAARYHIMIDAHEPIKDTGLRRTWPNFMTREGVRGMEWNAWSSGNPPSHTCVLPFTRMLSGPLDYTPGIFKNTYEPYKDGYHVQSTTARQLAYMVILYSPLQMAADLIENYSPEDASSFRFIQEVPCDWDDTRCLNDTIGGYVAIARRKGQDWWLGVITDEKPRTISIKTDFLDQNQKYLAQIWSDRPCKHWTTRDNPEVRRFSFWGGDRIDVTLIGSGGLAAHIQPLQNASEDTLDHIVQFSQKGAIALAHHQQLPSGRMMHITSPFQNLAVTLADTPSILYGKGNPVLLTDGVWGDPLLPEKAWLGFQGTKLDAIIDLKEETPIERIDILFLRDHARAIFPPTALQIFTSRDAKDWVLLEEEVLTGNKDDGWKEGPKPYWEYIPFSEEELPKTRYLRVVAHNLPTTPEWHFHKGKPAWLFVSEIAINAQLLKPQIPCPFTYF